jgi:SAM-dependent methyltransferase
MDVKEHYDKHLGHFYSWMTGDLSTKVDEFLDFLVSHNIKAQPGDVAVDLGAGNGIQTVALAKRGFAVVAIDFNKQLLHELAVNTKAYPVSVVADDLRNVRLHASDASVVCCCGDTLTHLHSKEDISRLITGIYDVLRPGGKAIFSFRDYSVPLQGVQRFIPVKSDADRILTCVLDYGDEFVTVTDLLNEREGEAWHQKVSSYQKVRLGRTDFIAMLRETGFRVDLDTVISRMITIVVVR